MDYSFDGGISMPIIIPAEDQVTTVSVPHICLPVDDNCRTIVKEGDHVLVNECVIKSEDHKSPPVYSAVSGTVKGEADCTFQGRSASRVLIIENDGKMESSKKSMPWPKRLSLTGRDELILLFKTASLYDPLTKTYLADSVRNVGRDTEILIVSCVNADPSLQTNHALVCSYAQQLVDGAKIIAQALHCSRILFAVAHDDFCLHFLLTQAIGTSTYCSVTKMKMKYPQGQPVLLKKQLAKEALSLVVSAEVCVHTFYSFAQGAPMTSRIISVQKGKNSYVTCEVPLGARIKDIFSFLHIQPPTTHYWNGGFVGEKITDELAVVEQNTTSIHWFSHARNELKLHGDRPCIRCGRCADVCPARLLPGMILENVQEHHFSFLEGLPFDQCMFCGACTYVCPEQLSVMNAVKEAKMQFDSADVASSPEERRKNNV